MPPLCPSSQRAIPLLFALATLGGCAPSLEAPSLTVNKRVNDDGLFPGLIGVANRDDDDQNGVVDFEQQTLAPNEDDLSPLRLNHSRHLTLSLTGQTEAIRVWANGQLVLGGPGGALEWTPDKSLQENGGIDLQVEFGEHLAQGQLSVLKNSQLLFKTSLTAAPLLLNHHLQPTEEVWMMKVSGQDNNDDLIAALQGLLGDAFHTLSEQTYQWDVWVQDEIEFATNSSLDHRSDVVLDSIRSSEGDGGLEMMATDNLNAPGTALQTWGTSGAATTYDSFGNLETSPPLSANGVDYPFGRIYYGHDGNQGLNETLRDFLDSQQIQAPFAIDTTWLCVGHVDEYTAFIPDPTAPRGFRLLYASTVSGFKLVDSLDGDYAIPRYRRAHGVSTAGEISGDDALRAYNDELQTLHLDTQLQVLKRELELTDDEIILLPAIFEEIVEPGWGVCGALSLIPGTVNLLLVNDSAGQSTAIMPDPFFRSDLTDQSADPVITEMQRLLPDSLNTLYVDDWSVYHTMMGEVHCGTNTRRTPDIGAWVTATSLIQENTP